MSIALPCPACAKPIKIRDDLAGKKARCPSCKHVFAVPSDVSAPPEEAAPVAAPLLLGAPAGVPAVAPVHDAPPSVPSGDIHASVPTGVPTAQAFEPQVRTSSAVLPWVLFGITLTLLVGVVGSLLINDVARRDSAGALGNALMLLLLWTCQLILVPMIGGFFLWLGCKFTKISPAPYPRCWLAYFTAYAAASVVCLPLCFLLPRSAGIPSDIALWLVLALAIGIHWVVVPWMLHAGFMRSLVAQSFGIAMTATLALLMALPLVFALRAKARDVTDMVNLRQIFDAMRRYDEVNQKLPPHAIYDKDKKKPLLSWRVLLLPHLEQEPLYREFHLEEPWDSEHNLKLLPRMPKIYGSAAGGEGQTETRYQIFVSSFPPKGAHSPFLRTHTNGLSLNRLTNYDGLYNTMMIAQSARPVPWTKPEDIDFDFEGPAPQLATQPGLRHFWGAMGDGTVLRLPTDAPPHMLKRLISHNDGQPIDFTWMNR